MVWEKKEAPKCLFPSQFDIPSPAADLGSTLSTAGTLPGEVALKVWPEAQQQQHLGTQSSSFQAPTQIYLIKNSGCSISKLWFTKPTRRLWCALTSGNRTDVCDSWKRSNT